MTEQVGALLDEYPGPVAHDSTGIGSAIREYPALAGYYQLKDVTMVGRARIDLFRNYIGAVERHGVRLSAHRCALHRAQILRGR